MFKAVFTHCKKGKCECNQNVFFIGHFVRADPLLKESYKLLSLKIESIKEVEILNKLKTLKKLYKS